MKIIKNDEINKTTAFGLLLVCIGFLSLSLVSFLNGGATSAMVAFLACGIGFGLSAMGLRVGNKVYNKNVEKKFEMFSKQSEQAEPKEVDLSDIERETIQKSQTEEKQQDSSDTKIVFYDDLKNQKRQSKTKQGKAEQERAKVINFSDLKKGRQTKTNKDSKKEEHQL